MQKSKEFLEFVINSLVEFPEKVVIEGKTDEMGVLLTLNLDKRDMGHIIGREGGTIKHIRSLLRIVGIRENARINLKLLEPQEEALDF